MEQLEGGSKGGKAQAAVLAELKQHVADATAVAAKVCINDCRGPFGGVCWQGRLCCAHCPD